MVELLVKNPEMLLFLVAGVGMLIGGLRVRGFGLGVAAILFVGLAVGGIDSRLELPQIVVNLGLAVFVYTIGLAAGPGFVASLRDRGMSANLAAVSVLTAMVGVAVGVGVVFDLGGARTAGLYAGALTNTPALASATDALKARGLPSGGPVVAYSLAYPLGVVGTLMAVYLYRHLVHVQNRAAERIVTRTLEMTATVDQPIQQLGDEQGWDVRFVRDLHHGELRLVDSRTIIEVGDHVSVVGTRDATRQVVEALGRPAPDLAEDHANLDYRRIFVSRRELSGKKAGGLGLLSTYGAVITRVQRGDVDMVADDATVLLLGDRVGVVAPRGKMADVAKFFGDSYRALSEVDFASFGLGLGAGLLVGTIPFPLPGGSVFRLGVAGGPLLIGLLLGGLRKMRGMVWNMPYSANLTLRQLGIVFFLAGIGTRSGPAFFSTLSKGTGVVPIVGGGLVITTASALMFLLIGHKLLRVPPSELTGMLGALETQPAVLAFAIEQSGDERPNVGYSTVYPTVMLFKLIAVQVILLILGMK